jgi:uncharacterized membrane protein
MITKIHYRNPAGRALVLSFLLLLFLLSCSRQPVYPPPPVKGGAVVIDASGLRPESPLFLTYRYHGKNISFFVVKVDGKVQAFFDACESCYSSKLGFRVDGGYIMCRKCNFRHSISDIEKGFGSCFPYPLKGHLESGKYLVPVSELEAAEDKF